MKTASQKDHLFNNQDQRQLTSRDVLRLIEENGGPEGLDLSNADLSGIDLSSKTITRLLQETHMGLQKEQLPAWATQVFKTSPSGVAFWRLDLGDRDDSTIPPKGITRRLRYSVNLRRAYLAGANLSRANLEQANLTEANLVQVNLEGAKLWACVLDHANLWSADLKGAYLAHASLEEAILAHAILEGVSLSYSYLRRANLYGTNLKNATLHAADLAEADLRETNLEKTSLWRVNLQGALIDPASIGNELLQENAEAFREHLEHHLSAWRDKDRVDLEIDRAFRRRFGEAREVYLSLKANFLNAGDNLAASWAHIKARQMQKQTNQPNRARFYHGEELPKHVSRLAPRLWWFYIKYTANWLSDWAAELSCGYGERPLLVLVWAVIIIMFFPLLFQLSGGISYTSGQPLMWTSYFLYSIAAFSTIGFPDLVPVNDAARLLTSLEALLGIAQLALFMFALGNRISRA